MLKGRTGLLLGGVLLLVGVAGVLLSAYLGDRSGSVRGGDAPITADARDKAVIDANNSPTLARNPTRQANLAVANRIDTPRFSCALNVSFDGGERWSETRIAIPKGEERKCFAPDVAFGSDGTLYMSFVTLRGNGNVPHAAWIVSSKDGGRTLSKPHKALGPLAFQVRLTPDPARPGRLYLSWLDAADVALFRFTQPGNPIRFARSDDGGATWGPPARVSSPARERVVAPSAAVGADGEIYVLYLDLGQDRLDYEGGHEGLGGRPYQGRFELVLARSRDGGESWEESPVQGGLAPIERFLVFLPAFPSLAVDRGSGRVYAGFHDLRSGASDVLVWSFPRGGSDWQGPTRVNDNPARDRTSQYLPKLAVAPNGRLDVVYYDRRSDPKDVMNEVSLQSSYDDGKSFTKRVRLSERRFDSRIGFGSERKLPDIGSRLGLVSDDSEARAVWTDTRAGSIVSNKQDIYGAVVNFRARLSKPLKYALRYGGAGLALVGVALLAATARRARHRTAR